MRLNIPREVRISPTGAAQIGDGQSSLAFGADGSVEAHLEQHNYDNRDQIALTDAAAIAQEALGLYGLARDNQLAFDQVRYQAQAGGSGQGDGELLDPSVTGTTVQFRQLINGLPVVTPEPARSVSRWTTTAMSPTRRTPPAPSTG